MQVIFAGKAHPADRPGQGVIQDIFGRSRSPKLRGRVFILEDYDIRIARFLVQGVDVWLNNPRRPLEASGTSGMKAAANGVVNVSVLDGWWDEGWTGDNGWAIGGRETNPDEGAQDWADAQDLYRILENELIPAYYERDADGLPQRWMQLMRNSIASTIWRFSTTRMLHEYVERLYLPAAAAGTERCRRRDGVAAQSRASTASRREGTVAPRISLALAIHNHQPVGNFGWVFAEVYEQAYLPMLEALERHPGVRLSLHYTGPLLEWLAAERPDFLERLARARRPRPGRDPGRRPVRAGARLAPRAATASTSCTRMAGWSRGSPAAVRSGRGWPSASGSRTCRRRWSARATAGRSSTTSTSGRRRSPRRTCGAPTRPRTRASLLTVFGTEQGLRYRIPFGDVEDVIGYLRDHATEAGDRVGMMGDDGEKFGAWPTTYEHCWGSRPLGRAVLRGARGEPRLADDRHAVRVAGARAADRPRLRPDRRRTPRWASGRCRPTRRWCSRPSSTSRGGSPSRGALAARRVLAQLPGQVPRDQRPPQADAPDVREGRGDADGPAARRRRSTTSTAASRTTATGTGCSAASTSRTCGSRRTST